MPSLAELVCVPPDQIAKVWPHARSLIRRAVERTNLSHFRDIEYDIIHGDGLLWLAWNGEKIEAAATTVLVEANDGLVCVLTACGGEDMEHWLPLLRQIEDYAKHEGCRCVRIYGRKGWARVLDGYRAEHVILERPL